MDNKKQNIFNKDFFKNWYLKKGFIMIDVFIITAIFQYYFFEGSFNNMMIWIRGFVTSVFLD